MIEAGETCAETVHRLVGATPCPNASQIGPVGARLAGESALKDAFAGKPGSYEKRFACLTDWHCALPVQGADLFSRLEPVMQTEH